MCSKSGKTASPAVAVVVSVVALAAPWALAVAAASVLVVSAAVVALADRWALLGAVSVVVVVSVVALVVVVALPAVRLGSVGSRGHSAMTCMRRTMPPAVLLRLLRRLPKRLGSPISKSWSET